MPSYQLVQHSKMEGRCLTGFNHGSMSYRYIIEPGVFGSWTSSGLDSRAQAQLRTEVLVRETFGMALHASICTLI